MVRIEAHATINRPIEEVFAYLSDIERQLEWVAPLSESRRTTSGPMGVGTRYRQVARALGWRTELECEITGYEPPPAYAFRARSGPFQMEMQFTLTSEGPQTRLTQVAEGDTDGLFLLATPMLAYTMKKQLAADLEARKTILESRTATEAATS